MSTIRDFMTQKHRACDEVFAAAEEAAANTQWPTAAEKWQMFSNELKKHLDSEEIVLFPAFEDATGNRNGPTSVMRMEHQQMRALIDQIGSALSGQQCQEFLNLSETLMVLMQQHNMKEEQMLYPMADRAIADIKATLEAIKKI